MTALIVFVALFVLLGVAGYFWGVDSRDPDYSVGRMLSYRPREAQKELR